MKGVWQNQIYNYFNEISKSDYFTNKIFWFIGDKGGEGKTKFCRSLSKRSLLVIPWSGIIDDANHIFIEWSRVVGSPSVVFIDLHKAFIDNIDIYVFISNLKDGRFIYNKQVYVFYEIPEVVVFANNQPNYDLISKNKIIMNKLVNDVPMSTPMKPVETVYTDPNI